MIQLPDDAFGRQIWFETVDGRDIYYIYMSDVEIFSVSFKEGWPQSRAYYTIEGATSTLS